MWGLSRTWLVADEVRKWFCFGGFGDCILSRKRQCHRPDRRACAKLPPAACSRSRPGNPRCEDRAAQGSAGYRTGRSLRPGEFAAHHGMHAVFGIETHRRDGIYARSYAQSLRLAAHGREDHGVLQFPGLYRRPGICTGARNRRRRRHDRRGRRPLRPRNSAQSIPSAQRRGAGYPGRVGQRRSRRGRPARSAASAAFRLARHRSQGDVEVRARMSAPPIFSSM